MVQGQYDKLEISELLEKLNKMHQAEEAILLEVDRLDKIYTQLQEDIELLELIIMHKSNKGARQND